MIGGVFDAILMRIVDTLLAVPTFILLIILASMFTLNLAAIILLLTVLSWPYVARLVRGQVLSLRTREFVQASIAMGSSRSRILFRHMLPNTFNVFIVTATFAVADSIYALSALSFLGLGPPPPFADWGTMLTTGVNDLFDSYPWEVYPGICRPGRHDPRVPVHRRRPQRHHLGPVLGPVTSLDPRPPGGPKFVGMPS